jgi:hypothetical protein
MQAEKSKNFELSFGFLNSTRPHDKAHAKIMFLAKYFQPQAVGPAVTLSFHYHYNMNKLELNTSFPHHLKESEIEAVKSVLQTNDSLSNKVQAFQYVLTQTRLQKSDY